jgi:uncharacterized membrane protein YedE/YeeE
MSIFEIIMLLCFGAAWPFSIYKSWGARTTEGKSLPFLLIVVAGYAAGILHKIFFHYDGVIYFYTLNMGMVLIDSAIYLRNAHLDRKKSDVS